MAVWRRLSGNEMFLSVCWWWGRRDASMVTSQLSAVPVCWWCHTKQLSGVWPFYEARLVTNVQTPSFPTFPPTCVLFFMAYVLADFRCWFLPFFSLCRWCFCSCFLDAHLFYWSHILRFEISRALLALLTGIWFYLLKSECVFLLTFI